MLLFPTMSLLTVLTNAQSSGEKAEPNYLNDEYGVFAHISVSGTTCTDYMYGGCYRHIGRHIFAVIFKRATVTVEPLGKSSQTFSNVKRVDVLGFFGYRSWLIRPKEGTHAEFDGFTIAYHLLVKT
ncbi:MAG: hypothetical protein FE034_00285 [Thermoplasmata archaeon]|nr:MAG: hypothetical protein FE034_00285 [Thermoplasmata archaeon]